MYFWSMENIPQISPRPVTKYKTTQVTSAVICTQPAAAQMLLCFVTSVLKIPCRLISAPESSATRIPHIKKPPETMFPLGFHDQEVFIPQIFTILIRDCNDVSNKRIRFPYASYCFDST